MGLDLSGRWAVAQQPEPVVDWLHGRLMGLPNVRVHRTDATSIDLTSSYIPTWAIVVAIFLFPVGLFALLAKESVSLRIRAENGATGGSSVQLHGTGSKPLAQRLYECYVQLQPLPSAVHQ